MQTLIIIGLFLLVTFSNIGSYEIDQDEIDQDELDHQDYLNGTDCKTSPNYKP